MSRTTVIGAKPFSLTPPMCIEIPFPLTVGLEKTRRGDSSTFKLGIQNYPRQPARP